MSQGNSTRDAGDRAAQLAAEGDALHRELGALVLRIQRWRAEAVGPTVRIRRLSPTSAVLSREMIAHLETILQAVGKTLGFTREQLLGGARPERLCWARFIAFTLILERCGVSASALGRFVKRDHGTMLNARSRCEALREVCPEFRAQWERGAAAVSRLKGAARPQP